MTTMLRDWRKQATPFFCDWLSISQAHPEGGLPLVNSGAVWSADREGQIRWQIVQATKHEGSYETSVQVRCDGNRVTLSGNLSRFGRPDNVFGFSLAECLKRANAILEHYGLPAFTAGERIAMAKRGVVRYAWTGARFSRIDLTANFAAGNADDAHAVLQWLGSQHAGRQRSRVLGGGETVDFGAGSRRLYAKAYIKHLELLRHGEPSRVSEWCASVGLVRYELTAKGKLLNDIGCAWLGDYERGYAMGQLLQLWGDHAGVMTRAERGTDDLDELPRHLRATARDYLAGMDLMTVLSQATFYRHRKALLPFGFDIACKNVVPFSPRVRTVELTPATRPNWYQLAAA